MPGEIESGGGHQGNELKETARKSDATESIRGTVERIIYTNDENNYTVAVIAPDDASRATGEVTVVGTLPELVEGESVICEGRWQDHKKFGRQFAVDTFSSRVPPTLDGLERYLASNLIDGVGPEFARRIVKAFGEQTLDVIEHEPNRLLEVPGIGRGRLRKITASWSRHQSARDVLIFLQGLGISPAYSSRIYRQFGAGAIDLINQNPYRLAEVRGIGFRTADKVAEKMGFDRDSIERARAGVLYTLEELAGAGHTCFPEARLVGRASELLGVAPDRIERAIAEEENEGRVAVDRELPDDPVYLSGLHRAEFVVAQLLRHIASSESELADIDAETAVAWAEKRNRIELDPTQRDAVKAALSQKVTVITGGPGVGKTTIINCIIPILRAKGLRVLLAAPTGRAARRLEETTGTKAQTIHRMLKWNPRSGEFQMNQDEPLEADAVIIDETSMIDITLMRDLLLAVPGTAVLILVGDVDQLPSVGPGNVLRDIIRAGAFPVKRLEQIFRQAKQSPIIRNAHRINRGKMPELKSTPRADREGFYFIERTEPEAVLGTVLELCTDRIPNRFGLDPAGDIQVMAPMYRGTAGVDNFNTELRRALNPEAHPEIKRFGRQFAPGDKVMQIRNDYDKDVFNGDIGRVIDVNRVEETITVRFEEQAVDYSFDELDSLQTAYAISVHKSQGSEYPAVVIALTSHHYVMLQRNLLYTAVTRGVRLVVIVGDRKALGRAVSNDRIGRRHTTLAERLADR